MTYSLYKYLVPTADKCYSLLDIQGIHIIIKYTRRSKVYIENSIISI